MIPLDHKKLALSLLSDAQIDEIMGDSSIAPPLKREVQWEEARRRHQRGVGPSPGDFPGEIILTIQPDAPRALLEHDGRFIWGGDLNDEFAIDHTYGSRSEAAAAARATHPGRAFQTARLAGVRETPLPPFTAEGAIDQAMDSARGEWGESAIEGFGERAGAHAAELDELLKRLWSMWCAKHNIELRGYHAEEIEDHAQ